MSTKEITTTRGVARVHAAVADEPNHLLVLGHGAGGGVNVPDLVALAEALPARGTSVALVEQPWRVAGKRVAPAPSVLDEVWVQVVAAVSTHLRLVVGGRSAGARVACRTARTVAAEAVVALAFPLHPPGRPERSRAGELDQPGMPTLVVQGRTDPFGGADEIPRAPGRDVVAVSGDHSLRAGTADVVSAVAAFLDRVQGAPG